MELLKDLNDNQIKAVKHMDGPCLVIAGAGSGKTKVLTTRVAYLIKNGLNPYNILAITFTNKAATEMKERIKDICYDKPGFIGTFHSFGLGIIRDNYSYLGLEKNFTILDSDDTLSVIKKIMKEKGIDIKEVAPQYVRNRVSFIKNENLSDMDIDKYFDTYVEKKCKEIYYRYIEILKQNNSVDFDDLLLLPVKLFQEHKEVLERYQERYKYILVDEYQDTNEVQYQFTKLLANKYKNIFVVGDPNQSIYAFRNANFKNILNFEKDYPHCEVIGLDDNYRSTNYILNTANAVIKNNKQRKDLELKGNIGDGVKTKYYRALSDKEEVAYIIKEIDKLTLEGYNYEDFGILYRTNAQARLLEEMFIKGRIPYKVVGSYYFYQRKEIKDLLCYLKLISNHHDNVAFRRVVNEPKRGIGDATINNVEEEALLNNISMFDVDNIKIKPFKDLILELSKDALNMSITELIDDILDKSGIKKEYSENKSLENELRLDNLEEFKSITASFEERTGSINLDDFLAEVSLVADVTEHKEDKNEVTMMTIHSAKGLEFPCVFLVGLEESIFPNERALFETNGIEEERRLCYVGITRAKKLLYLTNAKRRMLYGRELMNPESRFIKEIPEELLDKVNSNISEHVFKKEKMDSNFKTDFNTGDIVMHPIYGKGVIVNLDKEFYTIAFAKNYGIRKIMNIYKGLKKL